MKRITIGLFLAAALTMASCGGDNAAENGRMGANEKEGAGKARSEKAEGMNTDDPNVLKVSVPTVQCESCAMTISEEVKKITEVQEVDVDIASKTAFIKVANNTPEMQGKVEAAIAKSGYSTPTAQRDPAAYDALPDCCKEGGMDSKTEKAPATPGAAGS